MRFFSVFSLGVLWFQVVHLFTSVFHFELNFVSDMRSSFILFHVNIQFSQHCLLIEGLSFIH